MTSLLKFALEKIQRLPPEKQDQAARALLDVVEGATEEVYVLSDEDRAAIELGIEQADRGEFASDEEVAAIFAKYRT